MNVLTTRDRELLSENFTKLAQVNSDVRCSISKISVDLFVDAQEGGREIVVTSHFDVDAATALTYWDSIGGHFDRWMLGDSTDIATAVMDQVPTNARWRPE